MTKPTNPGRAQLISLSRQAKQYQQILTITLGDEPSINQVLMAMHKAASGGSLFLTFQQWKAAGYRVRKDMTSFRVWGKPKKTKRADPENHTAEGDEYEYYPMCCLFHEDQVDATDKAESLDSLRNKYPDTSELVLPGDVDMDRVNTKSDRDDNDGTIVVECKANYPGMPEEALVIGELRVIQCETERVAALSVRSGKPLAWAGGDVSAGDYCVLYDGPADALPESLRARVADQLVS